MRVEWDEAKNRADERKHGVSFDEASELFRGQEYLEVFDQAHSDQEDRFIAMIRIISARWATRRERTAFEGYLERLR